MKNAILIAVLLSGLSGTICAQFEQISPLNRCEIRIPYGASSTVMSSITAFGDTAFFIGDGYLFRTTNGAQSWEWLYDSVLYSSHPAEQYNISARNLCGNNKRLEMHANNLWPKSVYSEDNGETWQQGGLLGGRSSCVTVNGSLAAGYYIYLEDQDTVVSFSDHWPELADLYISTYWKTEDGTHWVADDAYNIYYSTDLVSWTKTTGTFNPGPGYAVGDAVSMFNMGSRMFFFCGVTTSLGGKGGWYTDDMGNTWNEITTEHCNYVKTPSYYPPRYTIKISDSLVFRICGYVEKWTNNGQTVEKVVLGQDGDGYDILLSGVMSSWKTNSLIVQNNIYIKHYGSSFIDYNYETGVVTPLSCVPVANGMAPYRYFNNKLHTYTREEGWMSYDFNTKTWGANNHHFEQSNWQYTDTYVKKIDDKIITGTGYVSLDNGATFDVATNHNINTIGSVNTQKMEGDEWVYYSNNSVGVSLDNGATSAYGINVSGNVEGVYKSDSVYVIDCSPGYYATDHNLSPSSWKANTINTKIAYSNNVFFLHATKYEGKVVQEDVPSWTGFTRLNVSYDHTNTWEDASAGLPAGAKTTGVWNIGEQVFTYVDNPNPGIYEFNFSSKSWVAHPNTIAPYKSLTHGIKNMFAAGDMVIVELHNMDGLFVLTTNIINSTRDEIQQDINALAIYPNPANDYINIRLSEVLQNEQQTATIYNTLGKEIDRINITNSAISTKHLPTGTYILKINTAENVYTTRFIKQ